MEFPEDSACAYLDRQYMLGDSLLIAPVFSESGEATWYLPAGKWTHLLSGKVLEGGRYYKDTFDYFSLPLFVRENTILACGAFKDSFAYDYADGVTLNLYQLSNSASCRIVDTDGREQLTVSAEKDGDVLHISLCGKWKNAKLRLVDTAVKDVSGAVLQDGLLVPAAQEIIVHI
jgi:alpha-D-xyloside xylohydrolase